MNKRSTQSNGDILENISRLSAEAEWTEEEINEALREDGIDPEHLVNQIIAEVRTEFPGFPDQLSAMSRENSPVKKMAGIVAFQGSIRSLVEEGEKRGLSKFDLADKLGLSIGMITKFNHRLIECSTIPLELIRELALTIGQSVDETLAYLRCKPRIASGLSFKADEAPELPEPQSFIEAVEKDRSLGLERKEELIAMAKKV